MGQKDKYRVSISPHMSPEKEPSSFCNPAISNLKSSQTEPSCRKSRTQIFKTKLLQKSTAANKNHVYPKEICLQVRKSNVPKSKEKLQRSIHLSWIDDSHIIRQLEHGDESLVLPMELFNWLCEWLTICTTSMSWNQNNRPSIPHINTFLGHPNLLFFRGASVMNMWFEVNFGWSRRPETSSLGLWLLLQYCK